MFNTPILLLIFNRPKTTQKVFNKIREQKPRHLYIAADGPRINNLEDIELCKKTREIVAQIDWNCEVRTLFRDENLGCGVSPAQSITWFFENVEQGIILEDDILTDSSFFGFCETMLDRYKNNEQIMHVSGCYFLESFSENIPQSYYFTRHIHVWGWATWRRAWKHYDYHMKDWYTLRSNKKLKKYYSGYSIFWKEIFDKMSNKGNDIWDYQWMFAIYKNDGIAINPSINLTQNIGFDNDATHTKDPNSIFTSIKLSSLSGIIHPIISDVDIKKDILYYTHFLNFDLEFEISKRHILWKLKKYLKKFKTNFFGYFV